MRGLGCGLLLVLMAGPNVTPPARAELYPDAYVVEAGQAFAPLSPADTNRPAWLWSTARGRADTGPDTRTWTVYEVALDRRVPFHHLLVELVLGARPDQLFVRLLDRERAVVRDDLFGNVADRLAGAGHTFLDIPLAVHPTAALVQFLIPEEEQDALRRMAVTPAAFEILMRTSGDFASGARAWISTPVYDAKNRGLLRDVVIRPDGQQGDLTSPLSAFQAYGVSARALDRLDEAAAEKATGTVMRTTFALDALPTLARFDVLLRNFDPLAPVEVWLNRQRVGTLSLALPDLEDAAYAPAPEDGRWRVGRWTRAWLYLPAETLRIGDQVLSLRLTPDQAAEPALEVAHPTLQLKYPWEELATYSLVVMQGSQRNQPLVGGVSHAPPDTVRQEDDVFIVRMDEPFHPVGVNSAKPDWLHSVERDTRVPAADGRAYIIRLHPEPGRRPHQLGVDIVYERGHNAPFRVSLLQGERMVVEDLFGAQRLTSGYVQMGRQLQVPLRDHPEADAVRLQFSGQGHGRPQLSRLQLKAAWPGAVLAAGHYESEGSLAETVYDQRSDFIPAEVVVPAETPGPGRVRTQVPNGPTGEWYGVETRVLHEGEVDHGDVRDTYFTEWTLRLDRPPELARVEFLVMHLNVVDGMEVFVNGKPAGFVSLHLPGVQDANYMVFQVRKISPDGGSLTRDERYAIDYGPYARATLVFDGRLLHPGANTIRIGRTPRLRGTNDHYTFKYIRLQLKY